MLHAILMAGGSGTRFWPASRRDRPKQLLALADQTTMIQSTAYRLGELVPPQRRWVITNQQLVPAIERQLPDVRVVGEPCRRDTAPCVGLAAALTAAEDDQAILLVMPSDHVIQDVAAFRRAVAAGVALIEQDASRIVTFGIRPTYPAQSFGYIQRGPAIAEHATTAGARVDDAIGDDAIVDDAIGDDARVDGKATAEGSDRAAYQVSQFREKPDAATAAEYLASGQYYWNSGIFLWRASTILQLLRDYEPAMASSIDAIGQAIGSDAWPAVLAERFAEIEGKSIDYAVLERHDNVVVIEAPFDWDDVGSWQAISRLHAADGDGNTSHALHLPIDTQGCIVYGPPEHAIVTIDVQDLVIVHTADATLVAAKEAEERVREAVQALQERGLEAFL